MRNIPWSIIDKYFKGLLTERDQQKFDLWLNSEPENHLHLQVVFKSWPNRKNDLAAHK